jgi:hypothetical protein
VISVDDSMGVLVRIRWLARRCTMSPYVSRMNLL